MTRRPVESLRSGAMPAGPPPGRPLPVQGGRDANDDPVIGQLGAGVYFIGESAVLACPCGCGDAYVSKSAIERHLHPPAEPEPGPAVPVASQWKLELRPVTERADGP
jgi:hypothetical protein